MMKTKSFLNFLTILFVLAILSGCASSIMTRTDTVLQSDDNHAVVTIFRPAIFFGDGANYSLWDGENLLGIQSAGSMIQYKAKPGEHLIMARAENWNAIKADLEAGRNYYIVGKTLPGILRARVMLIPANLNDLEKIDQWLNKLTPLSPIPEKSAAYTKPRLDDVRKAVENFSKADAKYITMDASMGIVR